MPWSIISVIAVICLIAGFKQGLKAKNKKHIKRSKTDV
jgi:hypothetical protein